eukprot:TRINITY_DN6389_c0_g1_i1.p1 TRINITY_DN6389_c0_g1~~TRINITY_DN6389_c0_g1_i1.p1  ORF type:complete len:288 (-),score=41.14 TRINITY_DN6389_c0_g1_i1:515-1378(-)
MVPSPAVSEVEDNRGKLEKMLSIKEITEDGSDSVDNISEQVKVRTEVVVTGVRGGDTADNAVVSDATMLPISNLSGDSGGDIVHHGVAEFKVEEEAVTQLSKTQSIAAELAKVNQRLCPLVQDLPPRPLSAHECNFTHYFSIDVGGKHFEDQYVYRHANGLCVVGLAPTHPALLPTAHMSEVDFNVGKLSRAEMKVSGKHKKNGRALEVNSALCKVITGDSFYLPRCCVRGVLLEVNERLTKNPSLLKTRAATEGHIAVLMPRPEDWAKAERILFTREQYQIQRGIR